MAHYDVTDEAAFGQRIHRRGFLKLAAVAGAAAAGYVTNESESSPLTFGYGGVPVAGTGTPTATDSMEDEEIDGRSAPPYSPVPDDDASQGYGEFWYGG